jgi:uncharacterized protein YjbI with pentapeptide repeats
LPVKGEYEGCVFSGCNFANGDLSDFKFTGCTFSGCNLSLVGLNKTTFWRTKFKDCKMLGLRFDTCNQLGLSLSFDSCQLNHASFYRVKIKNDVQKFAATGGRFCRGRLDGQRIRQL